MGPGLAERLGAEDFQSRALRLCAGPPAALPWRRGTAVASAAKLLLELNLSWLCRGDSSPARRPLLSSLSLFRPSLSLAASPHLV